MIKGLAHLYRSTIFSLERSRYILIVGHMRSRSSLLSHILGSHPAISGYAELRHSYLRPPDLIRLRRSAKATTSKSAPFYLDKLVSGWQQVSEEVVSHARVRTIFLIRKPKQTLRSIERLLRYEDVDWYRDPARVAAHYLERLAEISRLAVPASQNGFLFLKSEDLLERPELSLKRTQEMLGLDEGFSLEYDVQRLTGIPGRGDPSGRIRSGVVQQAPLESEEDEALVIDPTLLQQCVESHLNTCRLLESLAIPISNLKR